MFAGIIAAFVVVGALLCVRVPGNPIGLVILGSGVTLAATVTLGLFSVVAADRGDVPIELITLAALLNDIGFIVPIVVVLIGVPLIFPDGRLLSPRWRWIVVVCVAALTATALAQLLGPGPIGSVEVANPFYAPALAPLVEMLDTFSSWTSIIGFGAAALAVVIRYRRGDDDRAAPAEVADRGRRRRRDRVPVRLHLRGARCRGPRIPPRTPRAVGAAGRHRHRDPALPPVRHRPARQPDDRLGPRHRRARRRVRGPGHRDSRGSSRRSPRGSSPSSPRARPWPSPRRRSSRSPASSRSGAGSSVPSTSASTGRAYDGERTAEAFAERLRDEVDLESLAAELERTVVGAIRPTTAALWLPERGPR